MKYLPIYRKDGSVVAHAKVDDENFDALNEFRWHLADGYPVRTAKTLKGWRNFFMHRDIMNTPAGMDTDHIDGNKLDNQKSNLRICTHAQNSRSCKLPRHNSSGHKGISWHKRDQNWQVQLTFNGKKRWFGSFDTIETAIEVRDRKSKELYGEFSRV